MVRWSRRELLQVVAGVAAGGGVALLQVGSRGGALRRSRRSVRDSWVVAGGASRWCVAVVCRSGASRWCVAVVRRVGVFVRLVGCCCSSYKVRIWWCEIRVGKGRDY